MAWANFLGWLGIFIVVFTFRFHYSDHRIAKASFGSDWPPLDIKYFMLE